jgi:hypothetical protein
MTFALIAPAIKQFIYSTKKVFHWMKHFQKIKICIKYWIKATFHGGLQGCFLKLFAMSAAVEGYSGTKKRKPNRELAEYKIIETPTFLQNLAEVDLVLGMRSAILLEGSKGSGKSSLAELAAKKHGKSKEFLI